MAISTASGSLTDLFPCQIPYSPSPSATRRKDGVQFQFGGASCSKKVDMSQTAWYLVQAGVSAADAGGPHLRTSAAAVFRPEQSAGAAADRITHAFSRPIIRMQPTTLAASSPAGQKVPFPCPQRTTRMARDPWSELCKRDRRSRFPLYYTSRCGPSVAWLILSPVIPLYLNDNAARKDRESGRGRRRRRYESCLPVYPLSLALTNIEQAGAG